MTSSPPPNDKPAWVQLYEARRLTMEVEVRSPGRPPALVPRRKVGMTLSQGEIHELEIWQERLSSLLQRKISLGETVGILTRICTSRVARFVGKSNPMSLTDMVEKMVGQED